MAEEFLQGTIVSQRETTDVLRILKIEVQAELDFLAGQFTKIGLPVEGDRPLMRPYSFVNSPGKGPLEFYYDVLDEGGNLTPQLDGLAPGDTLLVSSRVNGLLHLGTIPEAKSLFMVATGTGIGPFLSILGTSEPWSKFDRVVLVWSVREEHDLAYHDRVVEIAEAHEDMFAYVPMVTRENVDGMLRMRVTEALATGVLEERAQAKVGKDSQFMLCGGPSMVLEMSDKLKERGLERNRVRKPGNFSIEKYW